MFLIQTVEDAQEFFKAVPSIREKMDALVRVGLGYGKVGQQGYNSFWWGSTA